MSMTIPDPQGIDAAGSGAVIFVPALADPTAPTATEIGAGTVLSCALHAWNTTVDVPMTSKARYCYKQPRERMGRPRYSAGPIVYDVDPQGISTTDDYSYVDALEPGTHGFMIDRRGKDALEPIEAGDIVDVWPVEIGPFVREDIDPTSTDEQTLANRQYLAVDGDVLFDVAVAGA